MALPVTSVSAPMVQRQEQNPYGPQTGLLGLLLGAGKNPLYRGFTDSGLKNSLAVGLAAGTNLSDALSKATLQQVGSQNEREDRAKLAAEWDSTQEQKNQTVELFRKEAPDLLKMYEGGVPIDALFGELMRRKQPGEAPKPIEINGQLVDPNTYQVLGDFRTPEGGPAAPSGYRARPDGSLEFIPGGPADPAMKGADLTQGEQRNLQLATVIGPELATVEQNWAALSDPGNQMKDIDVDGARPGRALTSPEYQQAVNSLSTIVASYLYSVSGATATDEEIRRQVDLLTPKFGESPVSVQNKLDRIKTYARAVTEAAGNGAAPAPAGGDDIDSILSGLGI